MWLLYSDSLQNLLDGKLPKHFEGREKDVKLTIDRAIHGIPIEAPRVCTPPPGPDVNSVNDDPAWDPSSTPTITTFVHSKSELHNMSELVTRARAKW